MSETFASSSIKNVVRGIHFQLRNPQIKIVSVLEGRVWDVIVDLRQGRSTYRRWVAKELSVENHLSFYIPRDFGHGFTTLSDKAVMLYQSDGAYDSETDTGIRYDDEEIGIDWPIEADKMFLSERDKGLMSFSEFERKMWQCRGWSKKCL